MRPNDVAFTDVKWWRNTVTILDCTMRLINQLKIPNLQSSSCRSWDNGNPQNAVTKAGLVSSLEKNCCKFIRQIQVCKTNPEGVMLEWTWINSDASGNQLNSLNICSAEQRFLNAHFNTLQPPPQNPGEAWRASRYKESQWMPCSEALPVAPDSSRLSNIRNSKSSHVKSGPLSEHMRTPLRYSDVMWCDVHLLVTVMATYGNCVFHAGQVTGSQQPNTIPQCHMQLVRPKFRFPFFWPWYVKMNHPNISLYSLSSHVDVKWSFDPPASMIFGRIVTCQRVSLFFCISFGLCES